MYFFTTKRKDNPDYSLKILLWYESKKQKHLKVTMNKLIVRASGSTTTVISTVMLKDTRGE
jgi:hypothetical protein